MTPTTALPSLQGAASASIMAILPTANRRVPPAQPTQHTPDPVTTSQPDQTGVHGAKQSGESSLTLQTRMTLLNRL